MARMTAAERQKDYYYMRIENGLCVRCVRPRVGRHVHCDECRAKLKVRDSERYRRRKATEGGSYALRRAAGLCARCPKPSPHYSRCVACRARQSALDAKRYAARKEAQALANRQARKAAA